MSNPPVDFMLTCIVEQAQALAELKQVMEKNKAQHMQAMQKMRYYYENILALMPGHVYWVDRQNIYLGCNNIQAKNVNLESRHAIVGKSTRDLVLEVQAEELDRINTDVMESGIPQTRIEQAYMAEGHGVYFSQKVPLRDEQGDVIGLLGISIDITELKKAEADIILAKESAEAANQAKTQFIANMSHDIRTPLGGVVGMSKLLEDRLEQPEEKQYARWINESGQQLLSLLNGILDSALTDNVRESELNRGVFDLRQCIQDLVQLELPTTQLKGLALRIDISDDVPHRLMNDRAKLHRILLNLLGNAIKFTPSGEVAIEVELLYRLDNQVQLQFRVVDTGIGIPADLQDKVFDRFFRAAPSYQGTYSGHGLGLHIARTYVNYLGGDLQFISENGQGTTFYFDLSFELVESEGPAPEDDEPWFDQTVRLDHVPFILLVEDNPIALRLAELVATQAGCRHVSAVRGEQAFELVKSNDFDLIVTDIGLADFSGHELARRIREWEGTLCYSPVPIVGLTAHALMFAKEECMASGMNDVICKPIHLNAMQIMLNRFVCIKQGLGQGLPAQDSKLFDLSPFPLLDIDAARLSMGNESVLREILGLMVEQEIPNDTVALQQAYADGDWGAIEKIAHRMKGGALYCGTVKLQYACQYLERYRKAGYVQFLEPLYQQLLVVMDETRSAIEACSL